MDKLDKNGLMNAGVPRTASEDGVKRPTLADMPSQSEHIRDLVEQSAAAVVSASAVIQQECVETELPPALGEILEHHASATRQLHEAAERLTSLNQVLEGEIRERTLLDHRLAAAFEQEEGSRKAALHDQLTGLPNRVLYSDRLEHGIAQATRHGWMLAVMFVDLNDFKSINDTHGHQAGDSVLKAIALRLTQATRQEDTVSRHGGDEFLCLLTPLHAHKHIAMIAAKILAAIQSPCEAPGRDGPVDVSVGGSIGISVFPQDGANAAELIRRADEAMYVAKEHKTGFAFAQ